MAGGTIAHEDWTAGRVPPQPKTELSARAKYQWIGRLGALLLRALGTTLRIRWEVPDSVRALEQARRGYIHAFWHAHILTLSYTHRGRGVVVLVSRHGDGETISQIIHRLGYGTVRGSSTRGGVRALLQMARFGREGYALSVTPDGPRGPRHVLQPGILTIAQKSGLPIVPLASAARRCRYLENWDRFEIPYPFTRVLVTVGEPIWIPESLSAEAVLREWGPKVEDGLRVVERRAEDWLEEGRRGR